jgi:hypothetical protein
VKTATGRLLRISSGEETCNGNQQDLGVKRTRTLDMARTEEVVFRHRLKRHSSTKEIVNR